MNTTFKSLAAVGLLAGLSAPALAADNETVINAGYENIRSIEIPVKGVDFRNDAHSQSMALRIKRAARQVCDYRSVRQPLGEEMKARVCYVAARDDGMAQMNRFASNPTYADASASIEVRAF